MKKILIIQLCLLAVFAHAQTKATDSTSKINLNAPDTAKKAKSIPLAFIAPAAMVAYGGLSFAVHPIRRFDYYLAGQIHKSDSGFNSKAETYFMFTPIVLVYGLNLAGVQGKNNFIDRTALLALSTGFMGVSTELTKHLTHRLRPNKADKLSFPSGHTSFAFMGAEFLAQEYSDKSPWFGVLGYGIGAATGVFRLYNRDHWFSDVVTGAGYGIISTKLAYLVYPTVRRWFVPKYQSGTSGTSSKRSRFNNTLLMPGFQNGAPGFSFTTNF